ncbi:MAG: hypothetical protein K2Q14_07000 [Gammaproteobacteria bacterium]|nr:hypothetical protein [Nitrosomonas sp.]MBY0545275.1 hypothetical protein [Gammaproteobacteria bacterium]
MADSTLSVLVPVEITDSVLTSTDVVETDYPEHDPGTTYALGERVISTITHKIYESAKAGNLDKDPTDINNRTGSTKWWTQVDSTNAWKMFDGEKTSATTKASSLTIVLKPGFINSLYAGGLIADTATITMKDAPGGSVVYSETMQLENSYPPDYYEYGFSPFTQQPDLILDDIPPYYNGEITFTLEIASGNVECGMFQVGDLRPLGTLQYNASATPKSYSYIKIDDFGNNEIKRRKKATDGKYQVILEPSYANTAMSILNAVLDVPVVCVATTFDDYAWLRTFGLVSGEMVPDNYSECVMNVSVKGLI